MQKFLDLRSRDPNDAIRFLSRLFKPHEELQLCLRDPGTGTNLDAHHTLQALAADLQRRAGTKATPSDFNLNISAIRRGNALVHPVTLAKMSAHDEQFSQSEVDEVIADLHRGSRTLRGSYAAVKASSPGGRRLTCALMNLSLTLQIVASTWAWRLFFHLRKKGPRVVQTVECLRPISLVTELAAILDGLLLARHAGSFTDFWGSSQSGGVYEALSSVLALT